MIEFNVKDVKLCVMFVDVNLFVYIVEIKERKQVFAKSKDFQLNDVYLNMHVNVIRLLDKH